MLWVTKDHFQALGNRITSIFNKISVPFDLTESDCTLRLRFKHCFGFLMKDPTDSRQSRANRVSRRCDDQTNVRTDNNCKIDDNTETISSIDEVIGHDSGFFPPGWGTRSKDY